MGRSVRGARSGEGLSRATPLLRPHGGACQSGGVRGPRATFGHGVPYGDSKPSEGPETQETLPPTPLPREHPRPPFHSHLTLDSQNSLSQVQPATPTASRAGHVRPAPRVRAPPWGRSPAARPLSQSGCGAVRARSLGFLSRLGSRPSSSLRSPGSSLRPTRPAFPVGPGGGRTLGGSSCGIGECHPQPRSEALQ